MDILMQRIEFILANQIMKNILVAFGYYLTAKIGQNFAIPPGNVTPLWPPSGIAIAAVFFWGKEVSPGIALGSFFSNLGFSDVSIEITILTNMCIAVGATLQAVIGAHLLKKLSPTNYPFSQVQGVIIFVFVVGFFSSLINSTIGTTGLLAAHFIDISHFGTTWITWWLGDSVGVITVASLIFAICESSEKKYGMRNIIEGILLLIPIGATYVIMHETGYSFLYIMLLIYIFIAFRTSTPTALFVALFSTSCIVYANAKGYTVFNADGSNTAMLLLQLFVSSTFITIQILCALINERKKALFDLQELNTDLEMRVADRTHDLNKKNSLLKNEMDKSEVLSKKLVTLARSAGMAEVANSVLHNAGNVLNSVNVSVSILEEKINKSRLVNLPKAAQFLQINSHDLGPFFTEDPKGRAFPAYIEELARYWEEERKDLLTELETLIRGVDHIKQIVAMQVPLSGNTVVEERLSVKTICEEAIKLSGVDAGIHNINFSREFSEVPDILIDKLKFLQILINLLTNSKDALQTSDEGVRKITLKYFFVDQNTLQLEVRDNGIGIPSENLDKIFGFGFSTKKEGHGTGLHSSAILAKEIGGSLSAQSDGVNKGATFILTLRNIHSTHEA